MSVPRCLLVVLAVAPLCAEEAPTLTLETGGPTGMVGWLAFTPDGRHLVASGEDKVVRLFDVAVPEQPRLERTLRYQLGPAHEGKLASGALSPRPLPDGGLLLASAGYGTPGEAEHLGDIRLINLNTGALLTVLRGHRGAINALSFSSDGLYLASASGDGTVRLWDLTPRGSTLPAPVVLTGHTQPVFGCAVLPGPAGAVPRVASSSYDGTVRFWWFDGARWNSLPLLGHTGAVHKLVASPDGRYVATGGADGTVRLWDALRGAPAGIIGRHDNYVQGLAFAPNSRAVVAGGGGGGGPDLTCRIWGVPGGGELGRFTGHDNTIGCLAWSPDGRLIAGAGGSNNDIRLWDPLTGRERGHLVGTGRTSWAVAFSPDGRRLALGQENRGGELGANNPLQLSFELTTMQPGPPVRPGEPWQRARLTEGPWSAKLARPTALACARNGQSLGELRRAEAYDTIRCYTFVPGGARLVLGSNYSLTVHDTASGRLLRELIGHNGAIWAVAPSPDGRYLASAGDQTVRLWNLATGELLVSIFLGSDGHWIAWTPAGYYTCSPDGDRLIGWHFNQGVDRPAQWVSGYQLRRQLYRPDVLARLYDAGSVAEALRLADAERRTPEPVRPPDLPKALPPTVAIVAPAPGQTVTSAELTVEAQAQDPARREVRELRVLVNGRDLAARGLRPRLEGPGRLRKGVVLVPGENVLTVIAVNDQGAESEPVSVKVRYAPPQADATLPTLYLLAAGVSQYQHADYRLRFAAKDAGDLAAVLGTQQGRLYRRVEPKVLTDREATGRALLEALEWLGRQATQRDTVAVFLAGHGLPDTRGAFYFLPADGDADKLLSTGLKWADVRTALAALPGRVLLFLDTCHSGAAAGTRGLRPAIEYNNALREAAGDAGVLTFASCMPSEQSLEDPAWTNGAFTRALTEGLGGKADVNADGQVTLTELDLYVAERVKALTEGRQHPSTQKPAGVPNDLVLAKLR